jgi:hypothetical protein
LRNRLLPGRSSGLRGRPFAAEYNRSTRATMAASPPGSASTSSRRICSAMRSVASRTPSVSPARSETENGRPYSTVTRDRNLVLRSKLRPTAITVTRIPACSAPIAILAAPVRSGTSRPVEWLTPSGNRQTASPLASAC